MGLRFNRRVRIVPGARLNFSKRGVSLSVGKRGAWVTLAPKGVRGSVGIPGTGLSYTAQTSGFAKRGAVTVGRTIFWIIVGLGCAYAFSHL